MDSFAIEMSSPFSRSRRFRGRPTTGQAAVMPKLRPRRRAAPARCPHPTLRAQGAKSTGQITRASWDAAGGATAAAPDAWGDAAWEDADAKDAACLLFSAADLGHDEALTFAEFCQLAVLSAEAGTGDVDAGGHPVHARRRGPQPGHRAPRAADILPPCEALGALPRSWQGRRHLRRHMARGPRRERHDHQGVVP